MGKPKTITPMTANPPIIPFRPDVLLYLFMLVLIMNSCSGDSNEQEEPVYQGKWMLEKAEPALDESYMNSYIDIRADRSFELYDSSQDLLIAGGPEHFSLAGLRLCLTDPATDEQYLFTVLSRKQDVLILETAIFGPVTKITLRKVSD
jgi:hypothetical protein